MTDILTRRGLVQAAAVAAVSLPGCLDAISASPTPITLVNESDQTETS